MRFTDFADADSPYMFHCHLLRHEDQGLMGQFVVARQGEAVGAINVADEPDDGDAITSGTTGSHGGHAG